MPQLTDKPQKALQSCRYIREMAEELLRMDEPNWSNRHLYESKLMEFCRFNKEMQDFFQKYFSRHKEITDTISRIPNLEFRSIDQPWKFAAAYVLGTILTPLAKKIFSQERKYIREVQETLHLAKRAYCSIEGMLYAVVNSA